MWETDTTRMDKQQLSTFFRNYVDSGSRRDAFLFSIGYHETSTRISFHKRCTSIYKRTSRFDACSDFISKIHERHENRGQIRIGLRVGVRIASSTFCYERSRTHQYINIPTHSGTNRSRRERDIQGRDACSEFRVHRIDRVSRTLYECNEEIVFLLVLDLYVDDMVWCALQGNCIGMSCNHSCGRNLIQR